MPASFVICHLQTIVNSYWVIEQIPPPEFRIQNLGWDDFGRWWARLLLVQTNMKFDSKDASKVFLKNIRQYCNQVSMASTSEPNFCSNRCSDLPEKKQCNGVVTGRWWNSEKLAATEVLLEFTDSQPRNIACFIIFLEAWKGNSGIVKK